MAGKTIVDKEANLLPPRHSKLAGRGDRRLTYYAPLAIVS
jgi:hypothetical protein